MLSDEIYLLRVQYGRVFRRWSSNCAVSGKGSDFFSFLDFCTSVHVLN